MWEDVVSTREKTMIKQKHPGAGVTDGLGYLVPSLKPGRVWGEDVESAIVLNNRQLQAWIAFFSSPNVPLTNEESTTE